MSVVLVCDLGASRLRTALIDATGQSHAAHTVAMPLTTGTAAEIDPQVWWQSLCTATTRVLADLPTALGPVAAIALSALTRSNVLLDERGHLVRPALLLSDTRSETTLPSLRAALAEQRLDQHAEAAHLNAFHPVSRLWWLRHTEPAAFERVRQVVDPKDYLNARLTGVVATDAISSARLIASARAEAGSGSLLAVTGLGDDILPTVRAPVSIMGRVRPGADGPFAPLAGVPVVTMAHDTWASVVGLGALRANVGYNLTGTTEVLGLVSASQRTAEGLLTVAWGEGLTQLGGPSLTGGDTLLWLLDLLAPGQTEVSGVGAALAGLMSHPRSTAPLLFVPYLRGERVPYWNPNLRGAFVGLGREHGAADLAQAVLEGVAFLNRVVLERAEAASGAPLEEIRFGGGGAANANWCQIKADVLGRPLVTTDGEEHGLSGAAIVAWTALGRFASLEDAQTRLVRAAQRFAPDPARRAHYDRLYALFREAEAAVSPISERLARFAT